MEELQKAYRQMEDLHNEIKYLTKEREALLECLKLINARNYLVYDETMRTVRPIKWAP